MTLLSRVFDAFSGSSGPAGPDGYRAFAIGDIHGRIDLLEMLLAKIEADIASRSRSENFIIFLGDLIDRGPDSAAVVERLRTYGLRDSTTVFLCGNHEEVMLRILAEERGGLLADWLKFGGAECLQSYGLDPIDAAAKSEAAALKAIRAKVPQAHADFLASFADTYRFGDYLCVHAGIRPGLEIAEQAQSDLRWIREPFLDDTKDHGFVVVHGHSISNKVEQRANRIGLDTGAYRTGILTALAIEGTARWFLDTAPADSER
jgi:serine/threonine protein phosphatase 1